MSIGDFSARCGLSAKMLRSYAAAGLLVPAAVDGSSGYRYYSTGQLHQARVIALLRRAGIAVDEIAEFFDTHDPDTLDRWDRQIVSESRARRQALVQARAALALGQAPPPAQREISRKGTALTHTFVSGAATHRGGRDANQDAVLVGDGLFAVADGLGGLQDGDIASRLALDTLDAAFSADRTVSGLLDGFRDANRAVWRQANGQDATMGTTLVALAVTSDAAAIVLHVGDSRLYRFRNGRVEQLTHDHTVIADLIRAGELSEADAETHPYRYVLTRAIGVPPGRGHRPRRSFLPVRRPAGALLRRSLQGPVHCRPQRLAGIGTRTPGLRRRINVARGSGARSGGQRHRLARRRIVRPASGVVAASHATQTGAHQGHGHSWAGPLKPDSESADAMVPGPLSACAAELSGPGARWGRPGVRTGRRTRLLRPEVRTSDANRGHTVARLPGARV